MAIAEQSEFLSSLEQGFINSQTQAGGQYVPRILTNSASEHTNVLAELKRELGACERFDFSVAFITQGGIATIVQLLIELRDRDIPGRILTTTFNNFNHPDALRKLLEFPNIQVRVYEGNLHTKGYLFEHGTMGAVVIGSANLTQAALCANKEWNVLLHSYQDGELFQKARREYELLWRSPQTVELTDTWIDAYEQYRSAETRYTVKHLKPFTSGGFTVETSQVIFTRTGHRAARTDPQPDPARPMIAPNKMQQSALASLAKIHGEKAQRALLISATGTGKTYLSAFDIAATRPERVLFVAHRQRILEASLASYRLVLGDAYSYGLFAGASTCTDATCLFAMATTLARHLDQFDPLAFDYIVVDETHRAGAESYRKILSHFAPAFVLGMTATPQRSDHYDIFALFNHIIAYRITLQDALAEDMLAPFHYYGVADLSIDDLESDDPALFNRLTSAARVDHIVTALENYSVGKTNRRGLIFCSRNNEARALSRELNDRGYRTRAVSGEDPDEVRDQAIDDLENGRLEYLLSVDILNEGVDIPSLNQIIMLRPTQSAIVFVQQLGRGLRKAPGKECVLVLDFIGNYQNNYLIPVALSGDGTYNKDNLRRFVKEGSTIIPGCSTISFDRVAEERIFEKIDATRFSSTELVRREYANLRAILGRTPTLLDFDTQGSIDPLLIFQCSGIGSYHDFLTKYEKSYNVVFTDIQKRMLRYVSQKLASGKRADDLLVLRDLIQTGCAAPVRSRMSVAACLTNRFVVAQQRKTFADCVFLEERDGRFVASAQLTSALQNAEFAHQLLEVVEFGIHRNERDYGTTYAQTDLCLYQKYSYEDAFRLLGWAADVNKQNVGGYMFDAATNTFPVFINYQKDDDISETTKYEDRFLSDRMIVAISKSRRTLDSAEIVRLKGHPGNGMKVYLFVRKNKNDSDGGKEFYFLGEIRPTQRFEQFTMPGSTATAVRIEYELDTPVRPDIYDYLTS